MATPQPPSGHRKKLRHYHTPGDLHELTFSCYQRLKLLTNDDWRQRLARCIDRAGEETGIQLVAFVFMPEHVHLLVYPTTPEPKIDYYLARIKQPFSLEIKARLEVHRYSLLDRLTVQERPGKTCFRFWQEGAGFDRNLWSSKAIMASIDYLHNNPVKRRFVDRAIDWKWSSARYFLGNPTRQQHVELQRIYGLPEGALDETRSVRPR